MHAKDEPERVTAPRALRREDEPRARDLSAESLLALQRAVGNATVVRMLAERQQRAASEAPVQRSAVHSVLRSPGTPLDEPTRTEMEARLGADFSDVRLHTDAAGRASAAEIGAHAYTSGNHVVIGDGGADPHTLAHELTHVIQQRNGPVSGTARADGLKMSDPGDSFERAAEANARRVMTGDTPAVAEHAGHAHGQETVQRMTMNEFDQTLQQHQLAGDVDFITFFEILRGRKNPDEVVNNPGLASTARLQALVQDPQVTVPALRGWIAQYQEQAGQVRDPATLNDPNITGLEMEMGGIPIVTTSGTMANGDLIAETAARTEVGPPVLQVVVEGLNRGLPGEASIELIYGPLPSAQYQTPALVNARTKLKDALWRQNTTGTLADAITTYNGNLQGTEERRFRLTMPGGATGLARRLQKPRRGTPATNTQTNISTPYTKLGRPRVDPPGGAGTRGRGGPVRGGAPARGGPPGRGRGRGGAPAQAAPPNPARDFNKFFNNPTSTDTQMFERARERANALFEQIKTHWTTTFSNAAPANTSRNLPSLLTQLLYQEAMYLRHDISHGTVAMIDKHHFDVLLKASIQDVVMTVLTDDDAKLLLAWVSATHGDTLAEAATAAYKAAGQPQQKEADATTIHDYLVDVLVARLVAGRQLLRAADDTNRTSAVYGDMHKVADVTHVHPRPSNRRPITVNNNRYYIVTELRDAGHTVNDRGDRDPAGAVRAVNDLQRL